MAYNILYDCASSLAFLQRNLQVRSSPSECPEFGCEKLMTLVKTGRGEERCFRCSSHKGQKVFLSTDTFFENSKLSYTYLELIFSWSFKTPVHNACILTGLAERIVVGGFSFFRDVCSWWLLQNNYQIGGPGEVVEIDESLAAKRENNVGRVLEQRGGGKKDKLGVSINCPRQNCWYIAGCHLEQNCARIYHSQSRLCII